MGLKSVSAEINWTVWCLLPLLPPGSPVWSAEPPGCWGSQGERQPEPSPVRCEWPCRKPKARLGCQSAPRSEPVQSTPPHHLDTALLPSSSDPRTRKHVPKFTNDNNMLDCIKCVFVRWCSNNLPLLCLSYPDHQMLHKETPGFSLFHSCWDKPLKPFQSTELHFPCLYDTHTSVQDQRMAARRWMKRTEWPGNNTEMPGRSPPKEKKMVY